MGVMISYQVCAQDIITSEFDGAVWKYEYQGLVINRKGG